VTEPEKHAKDEEAGPESVDHGDDEAMEDHDARTGFEGFADAFDRERMRLGSPADAALSALLEGGPEAVEHLLKAAQELLLAAKAVVDAGERAVESHREAANAAHPGEAADRDSRVRRIDLA
jgi:hypothetical protein